MEEEINIAEILDPKIIDCDFTAADKHDALRKMSQLLKENGYVSDVSSFYKDVLYRETLGETGIGNHLAIPHGQSNSVTKSTIAICRLRHEIEWETLDGKGVRVILLFAVENDAEFAKRHLRILASVARHLASDEVTERLLGADSPGEVIDCFR
ncbi:PTS sugar transporter subunit IIA [Olsenella profusa]|uniref:Phosphoenolpyruvate-dependent sugar PTS family porter, EIIA 2 component n=1 Tax=Olsenella profusa F0195 TaxID=1125712 RepID=U2T099_9ACTN|nr:fructose PTS transporter subunit IIA [Olsenella profusa]ERL06484.1 phosphoenolpyruvate-dependent sugar PTS family porter, EIIA 2 component [Olsenella profusa F0195]